MWYGIKIAQHLKNAHFSYVLALEIKNANGSD